MKGFFKKYLIGPRKLLVIALALSLLSLFTDFIFQDGAQMIPFAQNMQSDIQKKELDFSSLKKTDLERNIDKIFTDYFKNKVPQRNYLLFIYERDTSATASLKFWNSNIVLPSRQILESPVASGFALLPNGYYAWNKKALKNRVAVALFPVKSQFVVNNDFLQNDFNANAKAKNFYTIDSSGTYSIKSIYGNELFKLKQKENTTPLPNDPLTILLRIVAVVCVFVWTHYLCRWLVYKNFKWYVVFGIQLGAIIFFRLLNNFNIPFNLKQFDIFDPQLFHGYPLSPSLGDLALNIFLITWPVIFWWMYFDRKQISLGAISKNERWVWLISFSLIIVGSTFLLADVLKIMVSDPAISFDVMNAFTLNYGTLISFLVICSATICYYFICELLVTLIQPYFGKYLLEIFYSVAFICLLYLSFRIGKLNGGFDVMLVLWLMLYLSLINNRTIASLNKNIGGFRVIFWIFFFSISITGLIITENRNKEIKQRQVYAQILAAREDDSNELLVKTMMLDFRENLLAQNFHRFSDSAQNALFRDSLLNNNFKGFTNNFKTEIFVFDANENAVNNDEVISYNQLNSIFITQAKKTKTPGLYYYDEGYDKFSYITRKTISTVNDSILGYLFLVVEPKSSIRKNVYPELFGYGDVNSIEKNYDYAFAIYQNEQLVASHNNYAFSTQIPPERFSGNVFKIKENKGYRELWFKAGKNKLVVIVKEQNLILESLTIFSYLFCGFLLIVLLIWIISIIVRTGYNWNRFQKEIRISIRNQIHSTIIIVSFLSFIVIGLATIYFFINRYEYANRERMSNTIAVMAGEVENNFQDSTQLIKPNDVNDSSLYRLEKIINQIAAVHGVDVNLYDSNGRLKVSSLPLPYTKGIISTRMDPNAFYNLSYLKQMQFFQNEYVGKLEFLNSYIPVVGTNKEKAYLSVPYFTSQANLKQEISNFILIIINLNAFIFIIAGIISFIITNRITNSFEKIGEKMKSVDLGKINDPIEWARNDELGMLVNEYNKMLLKLNQSASELARVEREGAWSEMARQVAHEIKNPLTPMKLSLQFLQRAMDTKADNIQELTKSVSKTLIEQIEHLSNIASEFSQFANIDHVEMETFDLTELVSSVKELYMANENVEFTFDFDNRQRLITANKTQINRVLTNLILNGIQAVDDGRTPIINLQLRDMGRGYEICIKDNGSGISEEAKRKIFTPNFTTKSSGTGLGLAMTKRIVERTGGSIRFETEVGNGTMFYVHIPKASVG